MIINALDRGLQILVAMSEAGSATLRDLHVMTGVPKPSLLRILKTLENRRMVWRSMGDGRYYARLRLTARARYAGTTDRLVEVASPVLDALSAAILWPSDLAIARRDYMEICETTRRRAPIHLNRELVGLKIPMLLSAHGRAYLAFCDDEQRESALAQLRRSTRRGNEGARNRAWVDRIMAETRSQGFGTRCPNYGGHSHKSKRDYNDGLLAIAVPVLSGSKVIATINVVWMQRVATPRQMAARHLEDLRAAAKRIGAAMAVRGARVD